MRVMALTALLSSLFVYNSMNVIDEDAVERLGLVGEVVRRVREHAGGERQPDSGSQAQQRSGGPS